jgi:hypothetical protein
MCINVHKNANLPTKGGIRLGELEPTIKEWSLGDGARMCINLHKTCYPTHERKEPTRSVESAIKWIKPLGRWSTKCVLIYIRKDAKSIHESTRKMTTMATRE